MDSKRLEELYKEYKKIKGYADGGKVQTDDTDNPVLNVIRKMGKSFNPPPPPAPKGETRDEKYERIRQENRERMSGERPSVQSMDTDFKGYADGSDGVVKEENVDFTEPSIIRARRPDSDAAIDQAAQEQFSSEDVVPPAPEIKEEKPDRTRKPASIQDIDKEEDDRSDSEKADDKEEKNKKFVEDFEKGEEGSDEESEKKAKLDETAEPSSALQRILSRLKPQSTVDFGPGSISTQENLEKAQAQRKAQQDVAQYGMWGDLIGSGIAKAKPVPLEYFKQQAAFGQRPIEEFEEKLANEKNDPNSSISKAMKQFISQKYGMNLQGNPSAADLERISKPLANEAIAELRGRYTLLKEQEHAKNVAEQIGKKGEEARKTEDVKGGIKKDIEATKANRKLDDLGIDAQKEITRIKTSARGPYGRAQNTILFADKIPALLKQYKNLNDVPDTIATDANLAFANLISQGVPPDKLQRLLNKNNLPRQPAKLWEWLTAEPTGANQKEMLELIRDSAANQKHLAEAQLKDAVIPIIRQRHIKGMKDPSLNALLSDNGQINRDDYEKWTPGYFANQFIAPPQGIQSGKKVVKKGYNSSTNQTQFIYEDGSKEIKDGKL